MENLRAADSTVSETNFAEKIATLMQNRFHANTSTRQERVNQAFYSTLEDKAYSIKLGCFEFVIAPIIKLFPATKILFLFIVTENSSFYSL